MYRGYYCTDCGSVEIDTLPLEIGDLPVFAAELEIGIKDAHPRLHYKSDWSDQINRWWCTLPSDYQDKRLALRVSEKLIARPGPPYKNYWLTFKNWYIQEWQWRAEKAPQKKEVYY